MLRGSIPPTGLPLPFVSAGSTSLVVFMSAVGILLNIDKQAYNYGFDKGRVGNNFLSSFSLRKKEQG